MSVAPSSFCFICTQSSAHELMGMLLSLSLHHPGARVYGFTDTRTQRRIQDEDAPIHLDLRVQVKLDEYTNKTRAIMDSDKSFGAFLDHKANVKTAHLRPPCQRVTLGLQYYANGRPLRHIRASGVMDDPTGMLLASQMR